MSIPVVCPSCSAKLNAPDNLAGKTVKCPKCQDPVRVTPAGPPPAPVPARRDQGEDRPREREPAPAPDDADEPVRSRTRRPARDEDRSRSRRPAPPDDEADDQESDYDDRPRGRRTTKSRLPLLLVLVVVGFVALAGLGTLGYLFLARAGARAVIAPPAAGGAGPGGEAMALAGPKWVPVEDAEFAFKAVFPNEEPTSFDPLAEITDPTQRDFAAAVMKDLRAKYLHTKDGGRRYMLTATQMQLNGMPGRVYLSRLGANLSAMHPGFAAEPGPEGESAGHPSQDFTLKGDGKAKVQRVVVAPGLIYALTVEGGADLALADPLVTEFFGRFASTRPAAAGPKSKPNAKPKEDSPPSKDSPPATAVGEWAPFTGTKVKFEMAFPGGAPTEVGTLDRITDPSTIKFLETAFTRDSVSHETFETSQGGLRFVISAFSDGGKQVSASQTTRFRILREKLYEQALPRALRSGNGRGVSDYSYALAMKAAKVIVREVRVGKYSYFLRVEGPPTMHDEDPTVWHFLNSLKWPEDAIPKKK